MMVRGQEEKTKKDELKRRIVSSCKTDHSFLSDLFSRISANQFFRFDFSAFSCCLENIWYDLRFFDLRFKEKEQNKKQEFWLDVFNLTPFFHRQGYRLWALEFVLPPAPRTFGTPSLPASPNTLPPCSFGSAVLKTDQLVESFQGPKYAYMSVGCGLYRGRWNRCAALSALRAFSPCPTHWSGIGRPC